MGQSFSQCFGGSLADIVGGVSGWHTDALFRAGVNDEAGLTALEHCTTDPLNTVENPCSDFGANVSNTSMNEQNARSSMNIFEATRRYEHWMGRYVKLVSHQRLDKHAMMKDDPFTFFRGTYYRWVQLWPLVVTKAIQPAPPVLAVGDLHVDSFGTWRDVEGRLVWGVDDFDEAFPMPYTNDLVRLAASVKVAAQGRRA